MDGSGSLGCEIPKHAAVKTITWNPPDWHLFEGCSEKRSEGIYLQGFKLLRKNISNNLKQYSAGRSELWNVFPQMRTSKVQTSFWVLCGTTIEFDFQLLDQQAEWKSFWIILARKLFGHCMRLNLHYLRRQSTSMRQIGIIRQQHNDNRSHKLSGGKICRCLN